MSTAEQERLREQREGMVDWQRWGTYLSERAWGTVREDYSADGDAWSYFPFDDAVSRAYRWNEDGLAGWCDRDQTICLSLALWNGVDPILKERPFGLSNAQGNHGEDVKDYWFYTDNLPSHAYASMVYKYPQARFPYEDLVATNAARGQDVGEYELFDALEQQWRENRYFDVTCEYAKVSHDDVLWRITAVNRGPDAAPLVIIPQLFYRNTWTWEVDAKRPIIEHVADGVARTTHERLGERWFYVMSSDTGTPSLAFCENESNNEKLFGSPNSSATTKDGINEFLVNGNADAVSWESGSKLGAIVSSDIAAGESVTVTVRFTPAEVALPFSDADDIFAARRAEADDFYAEIAADTLSPDERLVQRQALAGLLWCKQFYHYDVWRWLDGDPTQPAPPAERKTGRNHDWKHLVMSDVILMPDAWEYPWFAAWDLAFHCVAMGMIDPDFAKQQTLLLLTSRTQHPHGQIPAYEWSFSDTNPPVNAWAAWQVYQVDKAARGHGDVRFLGEAYRALLTNMTWWLNQQDGEDRGVFGGGFLGMDNIGVFDRDEPLPMGGTLDEVDGTSWMATMTMQMLEICVELSQFDSSYEQMFGRWVWNAWLISRALERGVGDVSFWNEGTGFYNDVIELPGGGSRPLEVFSLQGLVPLFACISVPDTAKEAVSTLRSRTLDLRRLYGLSDDDVTLHVDGGDGTHEMFAVVKLERFQRVMERVLDPEQFLSPYGIRSLSRQYLDNPYVYHDNGTEYEVRYAPAESLNRMFGGNSNWRGPIWLPMNFMLLQAINAYARFVGDTVTVPNPEDTTQQITLATLGDQLARRLTNLVLRDADGRRAVFGSNDYFQTDPHWRDLVPFHEYFDGDNGRGVGASHQTGWTATIALLLQFGGDLRVGSVTPRSSQ
jgi:hypothetical protein